MSNFERVVKVIEDYFGTIETGISPTDSISDIYMWDDLDMQFLRWDLEEEFDIIIDNIDELQDMAIGDIAERLGELLND